MTYGLTSHFQYDSFSRSDANTLRQVATRIRTQVKTATAAIIQIGQDLEDVKERLNHGQFTRWVEAECGFSMDSAQRYMRVASFVADKSRTVRLLSPKALYRLSAKSASATIVDSIVDRVDAGDAPSEREIARLLAQGSTRSAAGGTAEVNPLIAAWRTASDAERAEFDKFRHQAAYNVEGQPSSGAGPSVHSATRSSVSDNPIFQARKRFVEAREDSIRSTLEKMTWDERERQSRISDAWDSGEDATEAWDNAPLRMRKTFIKARRSQLDAVLSIVTFEREQPRPPIQNDDLDYARQAAWEAHERCRRANLTACLIVRELGEDWCNQFDADWPAIGEFVQIQLRAVQRTQELARSSDPANRSVVENRTELLAPATQASSQDDRDDIGPGVSLVPDPNNPNVLVPTTSIAPRDPDNLDIPDFLLRAKWTSV